MYHIMLSYYYILSAYSVCIINLISKTYNNPTQKLYVNLSTGRHKLIEVK